MNYNKIDNLFNRMKEFDRRSSAFQIKGHEYGCFPSDCRTDENKRKISGLFEEILSHLNGITDSFKNELRTMVVGVYEREGSTRAIMQSLDYEPDAHKYGICDENPEQLAFYEKCYLKACMGCCLNSLSKTAEIGASISNNGEIKISDLTQLAQKLDNEIYLKKINIGGGFVYDQLLEYKKWSKEFLRHYWHDEEIHEIVELCNYILEWISHDAVQKMTVQGFIPDNSNQIPSKQFWVSPR